MKNKSTHKPTPLDINALFSKEPAVQTFALVRPAISPQLNAILKNNPDYIVYYAEDEEGNELKVQPKPENMAEMLRRFGLSTRLRGCGWTRKIKKISKKARKQSYASRKRNRR